jgi:hypothetical protein
MPDPDEGVILSDIEDRGKIGKIGENWVKIGAVKIGATHRLLESM